MTTRPLRSGELTELTVGLNKLARNLWWTWDQGAQEVFQELSPRGWQNLYHNAVAILHEVSEYELHVRLQDPCFGEQVREVLKAFEAYMGDKDTWAHRHAPELRANPVAYFSAEFGFHETLPTAAGGWASWQGTMPSRRATWGWVLPASACFTGRDIFSRRSMRTIGRRSITRF